MDERVASLIGIGLAVLVVVVVMNKHIVEEIIDDLRGVTSSASPQAPGASQSEWGEGLSIGGGGGGGGGGGSGASASGASRSSSSGDRSSMANEHGEFSGMVVDPEQRTDRRRLRGPSQGESSEAGVALEIGDAGVEEDIVDDDGGTLGGDAGAPASRGTAVVRSRDLPRMTAAHTPTLAVLRCDDAEARGILWFEGASEQPLSFPVNDELYGALEQHFRQLGAAPDSISLAWSGCSPELVHESRRVFTRLCGGVFAGLSVTDIRTERQLPMCGL
jgi:hypothetical protein